MGFLLVLLVHYAVTWAAVLYHLEHASFRFDHGGQATASERAAGIVSNTLSAPVMPLLMRSPARRWFPGLWGHLPLLLNSALWAGAAVWLTGRVLRTRSPDSRLAA